MEQATVVAKPTALRAFLADTIDFVESMPLMRPSWHVLDVALVVLFLLR